VPRPPGCIPLLTAIGRKSFSLRENTRMTLS
jgi:hypothetical protein